MLQKTIWPGHRDVHLTPTGPYAESSSLHDDVYRDVLQIRRHEYTVVGLTRRMVSSGGDPMVFVPLEDAQEAQFLKDNDAIVNGRARTAGHPALNRSEENTP